VVDNGNDYEEWLQEQTTFKQSVEEARNATSEKVTIALHDIKLATD